MLIVEDWKIVCVIRDRLAAEQQVLASGNLNRPEKIEIAFKKIKERCKKDMEEKWIRDLLQRGTIVSSGVCTGRYGLDLNEHVWDMVGLVLEEGVLLREN